MLIQVFKDVRHRESRDTFKSSSDRCWEVLPEIDSATEQRPLSPNFPPNRPITPLRIYAEAEDER